MGLIFLQMKLKVITYCFILPVAMISSLLKLPFILFLYCFLIGLFITYKNKKKLKGLFPWAGWANYISWIRFIILFFIAIHFNDLNQTQTGILLLNAGLMDGLDGLVARKLKQTTHYGKIIDEETDALFVFLSGFILVSVLHFSWLFLLPALLKYVKDILLLTFHRLFPYNPVIASARFIAGISFVIYPVILFLPPYWQYAVAVLITVLLMYSLLAEIYKSSILAKKAFRY